MERLKMLIEGTDLIVAPVALNAIMAWLAEEAGFKALYLSGGSLGWQKCVTEANLTLPEMAQVAGDANRVQIADCSRFGRRLGRSGAHAPNDRAVRSRGIRRDRARRSATSPKVPPSRWRRTPGSTGIHGLEDQGSGRRQKRSGFFDYRADKRQTTP